MTNSDKHRDIVNMREVHHFSNYRELTNQLLSISSCEISNRNFIERIIKHLAVFFKSNYAELIIMDIPLSYAAKYCDITKDFKFKTVSKENLHEFDNITMNLNSEYESSFNKKHYFNSKPNIEFIKPYINSVFLTKKSDNYNSSLLLPLIVDSDS